MSTYCPVGIMYIKIDDSGKHHLAYTDDMLYPLEKTLCNAITKGAIVDAHHSAISKEDVYSFVDAVEATNNIKFNICETCYSLLKNR